MITILISLTIIGIATIVILVYGDQGSVSSEERTIDDMVENSFMTGEIRTDLADNNFLLIQFRIVTDHEDAAEFLQKGEHFQLTKVIFKELTGLKEEQFRSGLSEVEQQLKNHLNQIDGLQKHGKVTDIFTIDKVLQ